MNLTDLEPQFVRYAPEDGKHIYVDVEAIAEADGISFLCPKCFSTNGGAKGTHSILCWRPGRVPDDFPMRSGRWEFLGSGYSDLSLRAGSSSVQLLGGCNAHFFIERGEVRMCP